MTGEWNSQSITISTRIAQSEHNVSPFATVEGVAKKDHLEYLGGIVGPTHQ